MKDRRILTFGTARVLSEAIVGYQLLSDNRIELYMLATQSLIVDAGNDHQQGVWKKLLDEALDSNA